jgi:hypothetical protein
MLKSRFLTAALAAGPPPPPHPVQVARLDTLSAEIDTLRRSDATDSAELRRKVAERAAVLERMRIECRPLATPDFNIATTLAGLRDRGQAALQLYDAGSRVVAVLLYNGELHMRELELSETTSAALKEYDANLRETKPDFVYYDPGRCGLELTMLVPRHLVDCALAANALLVSPHGVLNTLPWSALRHDGRRLFEHLPVAVVPNIAAIPFLASRPPASVYAALLGDPADADLTPKESDAQCGTGLTDLAALYGAERLVAPPARRDAATLETFRALLGPGVGRGGILHLACHGTFDYSDPAGSGLKLARRRLTAAEIALRPLGYAEVTLAACSTGVRADRVGDVRLLGDDILGLPASFLEAGARTVLVSTTEVGVNASQAFFHLYHRERIRGTDALGAYRKAQMAMLVDGKYPLRDWIGLTLYTA